MSEPVLHSELIDDIIQKLFVGLFSVEQNGKSHILFYVQDGNEIIDLIDKSDVSSAEDCKLCLVKLSDIRSRDVNDTRSGNIDSAEDMHESRLARSGGTDYGNKLSLLYIEGNVLKSIDSCLTATVYFTKIFDLKNIH